MTEKKIKIGDIDPLILLGSNDSLLQYVESRFDSAISLRNNIITIRGTEKDVKDVGTVFDEMLYVAKRKGALDLTTVADIVNLVVRTPSGATAESEKEHEPGNDNVILWGRKEPIRARTPRQIQYLRMMQSSDLVFAIGPAGTGKTYMAVAMALAALRNNEVSKIVLSRPAVEAGESLGFLPGDLFDKVHPYLRPLLDAVADMLTPEKLRSLQEKNVIEIIPLAYMRGRTLNHSFIILDEAQNTTPTQMKMFLTRMGFGSKAIVTGDVTQIDLGSKQPSGLIEVRKILSNVPGISFVEFEKSDVIRHRLVADIIDAYEREALQRTQDDRRVQQVSNAYDESTEQQPQAS
jgi:phosphate starvation-inducible PhoH-like protein